MGIMDGSPVERVAGAVWQTQHGTSPFEPMGRRRHATQFVACFPKPVGGGRHDSLERMFCRWHFCHCKKGVAAVGKTKRGKGTKLMVLADGAGSPLGIHVDAASPAEVTLLPATLEQLDQAQLAGSPERLIANKAYDSNKARQQLVERGIEPIIPARSNNRKATHQDGRKLRRYRHRWIVERTNSWLQNFRRLVVRYEKSVENFKAMLHMACALICLNRVWG